MTFQNNIQRNPLSVYNIQWTLELLKMTIDTVVRQTTADWQT